MIEEITEANVNRIAEILELYRRAKNRVEDYYFNSNWLDYVHARLKQGKYFGILAQDRELSGLALYQRGPQTVYVNLLFVRRGENRPKVFRQLLNSLRSQNKNKTIMIAEPAPDFQAELQVRLFSECGYEVKHRYEMFSRVPIQKLDIKRPQGFQIRKFKSIYLKQLDRLDREAYQGGPDELLFRVNNDISNSTPASKIVSSFIGRFDKSLSEFIFRENVLVGAIYCVARGSDVLVANIATARKYRKIGLASLLLGRVLNRMGKEGYAGCRLFVSADNVKALNLYKKFKFKVERNRIYCVYRLGQGD